MATIQCNAWTDRRPCGARFSHRHRSFARCLLERHQRAEHPERLIVKELPTRWSGAHTVTASQVAERTGIPVGRVRRILNRLAEQGHVTVETDGRQRLYGHPKAGLRT